MVFCSFFICISPSGWKYNLCFAKFEYSSLKSLNSFILPIFTRRSSSNECPWLLIRDCIRAGFQWRDFMWKSLVRTVLFRLGKKICENCWEKMRWSSENSYYMKGQGEQTTVSLVLRGSSIVENNKVHYLAEKSFLIWCLFKFYNSLLGNPVYTINLHGSGRREAGESWWISPSVAAECDDGLAAEGEAEGILFLPAFSKYFLLTAIQPEAVKGRVELGVMMLVFQNLSHSAYTLSNEDENPLHSFIQKVQLRMDLWKTS